MRLVLFLIFFWIAAVSTVSVAEHPLHDFLEKNPGVRSIECLQEVLARPEWSRYQQVLFWKPGEPFPGKVTRFSLRDAAGQLLLQADLVPSDKDGKLYNVRTSMPELAASLLTDLKLAGSMGKLLDPYRAQQLTLTRFALQTSYMLKTDLENIAHGSLSVVPKVGLPEQLAGDNLWLLPLLFDERKELGLEWGESEGTEANIYSVWMSFTVPPSGLTIVILNHRDKFLRKGDYFSLNFFNSFGGHWIEETPTGQVFRFESAFHAQKELSEGPMMFFFRSLFEAFYPEADHVTIRFSNDDRIPPVSISKDLACHEALEAIRSRVSKTTAAFAR